MDALRCVVDGAVEQLVGYAMDARRDLLARWEDAELTKSAWSYVVLGRLTVPSSWMTARTRIFVPQFSNGTGKTERGAPDEIVLPTGKRVCGSLSPEISPVRALTWKPTVDLPC